MKHTKRRPRQYDLEVAWDIESCATDAERAASSDPSTLSWSQVACVCAVDTEGRSLETNSLREYVTKAREFGWLRSNVRHWSHYGGIYDHYLLLAELLEPWKIQRGTYTSGMGLWSVDLMGPNGAEIILRDSARLMPDGLSAIGQAFGLSKLEVNRSRLEDLTDAERKTYCTRDCNVLLLAVREFRRIWQDFGAEIANTLAATSVNYLRRNVVPESNWDWSLEADDNAAKAYAGGRVEAFCRSIGQCNPGAVPLVNYYDINSSYPWSMTKPLPTRLRSYSAGQGSKVGKPDTFSIVEADVLVADDARIGPLPWKPTTGPLRDRLVFPTGAFRGHFVWDELMAMEDTCTGTIRTVHQSWTYDTAPYLASFIAHWHSVKNAAKTPAEKYIAKLAMNSVSGKLIEAGEYECITQDRDRVDKYYARAMKNRDAEIRINRHDLRTNSGAISHAWILDESRTPGFRHAAGAAAILSSSRVKLFRAMHALDGTSQVAYCDTDSIITDGNLVPGKNLGDWTHEGTYSRGEFLSSKVYALFDADGNPHRDAKSGRPAVRCKGFRLPRDCYLRAPEDWFDGATLFWDNLKKGKPVYFESTRGFKTGMAESDITFKRITVRRKFGKNRVDKREFFGNHSRPWNAAEYMREHGP